MSRQRGDLLSDHELHVLSCMLARLRNRGNIAVSDWELLRSHDRLIYSTGADVQMIVRNLRRDFPPHIRGLEFARAKVTQLMSERHAASVALLARSQHRTMRAAVREHAVLFAPVFTPLANAYCGTWARLSQPGPPMVVLLRAIKSNAINAEHLIIGVVQRINVSLFNAAARTSPAPAAFIYCQAQLTPLFAQFVLQHSRVSGASNGEKYARSAVPYVTLPYMPSHMTLKRPAMTRTEVLHQIHFSVREPFVPSDVVWGDDNIPSPNGIPACGHCAAAWQGS